LVPVDARASLLLAGQFGIYAYDAYFLRCSMETKCPLLTLDRGMKRVAQQLNITLVEKS
jgi:predicted nucleic acid-binding protein